MSEDGVYKRVEGVAHSNICLYSRDVKLETPLRRLVPNYGAGRARLGHGGRSRCGRVDQNWFIGILNSMGGSRLK